MPTRKAHVDSVGQSLLARNWQLATGNWQDVWAVGTTSGQAPRQTLVEHWDGSRWSVVPSANTNDSGRLYQVRALSARTIWAVGSDGAPLVEHWNGAA